MSFREGTSTTATENQVLIVAAEASSFHYAAQLLRAWKAQGRNIQAFGVGSPEMEAMGFERLGRSEDMAIVGAVEILNAFGMLKGVFDRLVQAAVERRPKVAIVMDYPEFNLLLSRKLHKLGIPVVYYISPQVWAWRRGRVQTIKKYCRKVLLLFPFEIPFYEQNQVPNVFVGHPILDELDPRFLDPVYRKTHRGQVGIKPGDVVLGLMPGSRRLELRQHFAIQLEVAKRLSLKHPQVKVLILVAPSFEKEDLLPYLEDFRMPYILLKDDPFRMIHLTDMILAASGTATLMVGLLHKPMVIMYRMKFLTSLIAKTLVRGAKFFGIVNLILDREVVPERFQADANPEELSRLLERYILEPDYRDHVVNELKTLEACLGEKGATARVLAALDEYLVP